MSKQADDAFLADVIERAGNHYPHDIIRATLAVAAERGLVVGEGAPRMWAVKGRDGAVGDAFSERDDANDYRGLGETVVRVAIVEVKE